MVTGRSGLTKAYTSVLSALGSWLMRGASRWPRRPGGNGRGEDYGGGRRDGFRAPLPRRGAINILPRQRPEEVLGGEDRDDPRRRAGDPAGGLRARGEGRGAGSRRAAAGGSLGAHHDGGTPPGGRRAAGGAAQRAAPGRRRGAEGPCRRP